MRDNSENRFTSFDGKEIFYRAWDAVSQKADKAIVIVHRGHEHSARMQHIVDELGLDDFAFFCMDARGHGLTEGPRGYSKSFGTSVKDLDCFVKHISKTYNIPVSNISVIAQSVGAVYALTWVHDYAPEIRSLILGSPALNINLYVPFARTFLSLYQRIRGTFFIKSYVKPHLLTHDPKRAESYRNDELITSEIASNILLELYENSERIIADAYAISVPTQLFISGSDYVVKRKQQIELYKNLGSSIKEKYVLDGFFHDTFGEKDRADIFKKINQFIRDRYNEDQNSQQKRLINLDKWGHNADLYRSICDNSYDQVCACKKFYYGISKCALNTLGTMSEGIKLGVEKGFDSGSSLDYVYENKPRGITFLGKLFDKIYLKSPGWKGIRTRKENLENAIKNVASTLEKDQNKVKLVDIAAGHGRYILDALKQLDNLDSALLRDYSDINVSQGAKLIDEAKLSDKVQFVKGDAFDKGSLANITPKCNIGVVSGLYELFNDNTMISDSLSGLYDAIEDNGYLIYTNQPWHPQLEYIAYVLTSFRDNQPWVMRCRTQAEMDALVKHAGFTKIDEYIDEQGIFSVSIAKKIKK